MATDQRAKPLDAFVQREKRLQLWIWASVLLPLALFATVFVMVSNELKTLNQLKHQDQELQQTIKDNDKKIAAQKEELAKNDLALSAFKAQHSGNVPSITYYRLSIGPQLNGALEQLGFNPPVKVREDQANPALRNKPVDTLDYGCAVTEQDIRVIAAALIKGNIPIRRIAPATKKPDPLLVQLIASAKADSNGPSIDPATWKKDTPGCAAK